MLIPSASATIVRSVLLAGKVSVTLPGQVLTPNLQSPDRNMRPLRSLMNCLRETKGVAALEFALIGPFLCIFILGVVDLGFGFQAQMAVTQAAQAGSYAGLLNGFNTATIQSAVANSTGVDGITASPTATQSCGCPSGTAVTATPCGSTCSNGQTAGTYITVNAQYQYSTMLTYPGLSSPMMLAATSTVRIK